MNLKFEYNKTSLQNLNRQLKIRQRALPTLKNKESALRMEVKNARKEAVRLKDEIKKVLDGQGEGVRIWTEYDRSLVKVSSVRLKYRKIAGVRIPEPDEVLFEERPYNIFSSPKWYTAGTELLKRLIRMEAEQRLMEKKVETLEYARKKTTQKVNLYEKVQIPAYENAVMKIKRYLEDEENLAKASQKIVKNRQQKEMEAQL
jgi:V/A-type H+-transporting ATPase subunit D